MVWRGREGPGVASLLCQDPSGLPEELRKGRPEVGGRWTQDKAAAGLGDAFSRLLPLYLKKSGFPTKMEILPFRTRVCVCTPRNSRSHHPFLSWTLIFFFLF